MISQNYRHLSGFQSSWEKSSTQSSTSLKSDDRKHLSCHPAAVGVMLCMWPLTSLQEGEGMHKENWSYFTQKWLCNCVTSCSCVGTLWFKFVSFPSVNWAPLCCDLWHMSCKNNVLGSVTATKGFLLHVTTAHNSFPVFLSKDIQMRTKWQNIIFSTFPLVCGIRCPVVKPLIKFKMR